ncbi:unnamed protein product [Penicillium salamii]|uniref:L-dopachrome isomerase n=1 Tax=Penicillium salamii TaxID=1612424 RepID=A0A9W4JCR8_9EURO|nr:unnamed protein product [Penicillium salamii]CAG7984942.1 unnamed protein product [Penicillium salamii]CAG8078940.1 unnamed protein product [Penicillium salamii]CAG8086838.1 unnamed protein product [Penicillium salamii]CAG8092267.1 unnamed protein product [Penicillium salamii]
MDLKAKTSLPRLTTNFPLFEKPHNASTQNLVVPERPTRDLTFLEEEIHKENIAPIARPEIKPAFKTRKDMEDPLAAKMKVYYGDIFATRESHNSPKDRVTFESVVVAELKTNTQVKGDASRALSEFSHALAEIYQRPETSMLVAIDQNADLLFGITTGPAYLLKVAALASMIAPLTNLRNTSLIQSSIQDIFDIPPENGVIIFNPLSEDNLATNGVTAREEINRLERSDQSPSFFRSISRSMSRRLKSSGENSAPPTLSPVMGPDVANTAPRSPIASPSTDVSPFILDSPGAIELADPVNSRSPAEESSGGNSPKRTLSTEERADRPMRRRESLRSFVTRRLMEFGEVTPFGSPKSPVKGNKE